MQERCPICGRKIKEGSDQCKACKSSPDEKLVAEMCHATHIVNFMVKPYVNVLLTNRRLLVFEDLSGVGAEAGSQGGLVGRLVGAAADKIVSNSLGLNGTMKVAIPLADVVRAESKEVSKGREQSTHVSIHLQSGKTHKFGADPFSANEFLPALLSALHT